MQPRHGLGAQRAPAGRLFVPVRTGRRGHLIRLFRTPLGARTIVGFTTRARLATELGDGQACVELAEPILRALAEPLGVTRLIVDPYLVAAPVAAQTVLSYISQRPPLQAEEASPRAAVAPVARGRHSEVSPRRRASGPGSLAGERGTYRS
ncbi:SAV_915 family protein [Streptomyces sp. NPDC002589]|uniref:SAV_915 family protein n=1 Tax=Streptomyces sp. NPDC002589 TaxID=3154420 RepID=UPI00332C6E32